jgi:hypothetical protein
MDQDNMQEGDQKDKPTAWREALEEIVERTRAYKTVTDETGSPADHFIHDLREIAVAALAFKVK